MDRKKSRQLRYYHKKKELEGETFLKKEAERKRKEYVPTKFLNSKDAKKRRNKLKLAMRKSREKRKRACNREHDEIDFEGPTVCKRATRSSLNNNGANDSVTPMVVKFPFMLPDTSRSTGESRVLQKDKLRRRISHATSKLRRANAKLEGKIGSIKKKLKTTQRQNERLSEKIKKITQMNDNQLCTPQKRASCSLFHAGIQPEQVPDLHKELVALHTVARELQVTEQHNKDVSLSNAVTGNYARKTRSVCRISKILKMNVKKLRKSRTKRLEKIRKRGNADLNEQKRRSVLEFLKRDDISSLLPGKKDGKGEQQLRVLNDYTYNLLDKYIEEGLVRVTKNINQFPKKKDQYAYACNIRILSSS